MVDATETVFINKWNDRNPVCGVWISPVFHHVALPKKNLTMNRSNARLAFLNVHVSSEEYGKQWV